MSLVPPLTSNISGLPFVQVSASSERDSNYAYKPFGATGSNWSPTTGSIANQWLKISFDTKIRVTSYLIGNVSGNSSFYNQLPKKWELQGSNDDFSTFDVLDIQDNQTWTAIQNKTFNITNTNGYKQYRLYFLSNNGNANYLIVGKIALYGEVITSQHKILFLSNNKTYSLESNSNLLEIPKANLQNFLNYGGEISLNNFSSIHSNKNYILQDGVSEDADGLWKQQLNRKPLSIKFE